MSSKRKLKEIQLPQPVGAIQSTLNPHASEFVPTVALPVVQENSSETVAHSSKRGRPAKAQKQEEHQVISEEVDTKENDNPLVESEPVMGRGGARRAKTASKDKALQEVQHPEPVKKPAKKTSKKVEPEPEMQKPSSKKPSKAAQREASDSEDELSPLEALPEPVNTDPVSEVSHQQSEETAKGKKPFVTIKSKAPKKTKAAKENEHDEEESEVVKRPKTKTKAAQVAQALAQLGTLSKLIKDNIEPYTSQAVQQIKEILHNLGSDNNRVAMFLEYKSYTDNSLKKKGLDSLTGMDQKRFNLLKQANDQLPESEQFDFYIFDSFLSVSDRKSEVKSNVHFSCVYDPRGQIVKKHPKRELKKKRNTFKHFVSVSFNPNFELEENLLEDAKVWEVEGKVNVHYDDYGMDEMCEDFGRQNHYGYNPFWSSDESPEPRHKTTEYKSHFLVFWPRAFGEENVQALDGVHRARNAQGNETTVGATATTSKTPAKPKKAAKVGDYLVEYAKSSRAHCRECHAQIAKDALRIAIHIMGDYHFAMPAWYHVDCFVKSDQNMPKNTKAIGDFDSIKPQDQERIRTTLKLK